MWFRALSLYPLTAPLPLTFDALETALARQPFRPCGALELATHGFEPVFGAKSKAMVHGAEGVWTFRWVQEEKRLPASFVKEQLLEKIHEFEAQEGHPPGTSEKRALRESIEHALLPRLIPRRRRLWAALDKVRGWMLIESANGKQAEGVLGALRQAIGSLPVRPWRTQEDWSMTMTRWLKEHTLPEGFTLDQTCVLSAEDKTQGLVSLRRHDLTTDEVQVHLAAGKRVTRLGLIWRERMHFVLDAKGVIRNIRPSDVLLDSLEQEDEDTITVLDQTLVLQHLTLRALLDDLHLALGGLARREDWT